MLCICENIFWPELDYQKNNELPPDKRDPDPLVCGFAKDKNGKTFKVDLKLVNKWNNYRDQNYPISGTAKGIARAVLPGYAMGALGYFGGKEMGMDEPGAIGTGMGLLLPGFVYGSLYQMRSNVNDAIRAKREGKI